MAIAQNKVTVTLSLEPEAHQLALDYAGARGLSEFISRLILEHRSRQRMTPAEVAAELRQLAEVLESTT
jgi:hypothetical protein